jgi:hypothetical protein
VLATALEALHYLLLSENIYRKLVEWFGGGPEVTFPIVSLKGNEPIAARPFTISLHFLDRQSADHSRQSLFFQHFA